MESWAESSPVRIALSPTQAKRLKHDWYYQHAHFEEQPDGRVLMTFGQNRSDIVLELVRWLGPGAELLEPVRWRDLVQHELETMLRAYDDSHQAYCELI